MIAEPLVQPDQPHVFVPDDRVRQRDEDPPHRLVPGRSQKPGRICGASDFALIHLTPR